MSEQDILVTGAAGFIGFHITQRLLESGRHVVGLDNINDYYDPNLKMSRLGILGKYPRFKFEKLDLTDRRAINELFERTRFPVVIHMAAQAGVRYSLENPHAYVDANLSGFTNVLEGCRHSGCCHLIYASSSSVYGSNTRLPFSVHDNVDHPVSFYAASKKANELMAHSYSHLYQLPCTGLRFFTVYGPWYRPDMALFLFAEAITNGTPIKLFNNGLMRRDFTYIDDVTDALVRLIDHIPGGIEVLPGAQPDPASSSAPWRIYNIGNSQPEELVRVIDILEQELGCKAEKIQMPMQPGDVLATFADVDDLVRDVGFKPSTTIEVGIKRFASWYRRYRENHVCD